MVFGVERSDIEKLIEVARRHDIANPNVSIHMLDQYNLMFDNEGLNPHGKTLFNYMRGFNYEQIQTIQTIVHIGREKNTCVLNPEDLFDEKLVSIRWSGDSSTEILKLMSTSDISTNLENGLKLLSKTE